MREEEGLTPAEREFEAALAGLQPTGASIDRDQMMYRAGYAAGNRRSRIWQGATVVLAIAFAGTLAMRTLVSTPDAYRQMANSPSSTQRMMVVVDDARTDTPRSAGTCSYLTLRNEVLEKGLVALPSPRTGSTSDEPPLTIESLLGRGS